MAFYIGLSHLSNIPSPTQEDRRREGRRILSLLDAEVSCKERSSDQTMLFHPSGKPYFKDQHAEFSISHSASLAAVSLITDSVMDSSGWTGIGCDVQYMHPRRKYDNISADFFHPREQIFIDEALNLDNRLRRFYSIWVLKESFLKMMGWSVFDILKTPVFLPKIPEKSADEEYQYSLPEDREYPSNGIVCCLKEYKGKQSERYMLGAILKSGKAPPSLPVIQWYSKNTLQDGHLSLVINIDAAKVVVRPMKTVKPNT